MNSYNRTYNRYGYGNGMLSPASSTLYNVTQISLLHLVYPRVYFGKLLVDRVVMNI